MAGFGSIKGRTIRATRRDNCGQPIVGPASVVISNGFVKVDSKRVMDTGTEFYVKNAFGEACINDIDADRIKRLALDIQLCRIDPAAVELMTGYRLITDGSGGTGALTTPATPTSTTATTGGTLVAGTYGYRVSGVNALGETLASTEKTQVVPAGTATNTVTVTWTAVTGVTGYNVYGRTPSGEYLLANLGVVLTYVDTGAAVPNGFIAPPTVNTTGSAPVLIGNAFAESSGLAVNGGGFSLELWSKVAGAGCGTAGGYSWIHWAWPFVRYGVVGDFTFDLSALAFNIMGTTIGNPNFQNGGFNQFTPVVGATEHLLYQLTNTPPPVASDGYQAYALPTGALVAA